MINYPLTRANRIRIGRAFGDVQRVDIGIQSALEGQMGVVHVDSTDNPRYFFLEQDSFFGYLAGDFTTDDGHDFLRALPRGRFLMAGSGAWVEALQTIYGDGVMPIPRHHYDSVWLSANRLNVLTADNPNTANIQPITAELAGNGLPFLEIGAFDSPDDFYERGVGFTMMHEGNSIGVAYSSLVCAEAIEISIVVDENHRRKGIATALACQLLRWCLQRHVVPHWDAANDESCALAEKLGYTDKQAYTAYFLKPE